MLPLKELRNAKRLVDGLTPTERKLITRILGGLFS